MVGEIFVASARRADPDLEQKLEPQVAVALGDVLEPVLEPHCLH